MKFITVIFSFLCSVTLAFTSKKSKVGHLYRSSAIRVSVLLPTPSSSFSQRKNHEDYHLTDKNKNYAMILNELSKRQTKEAAEKAHKILHDMCLNARSDLNVVHFASVIKCHANIGNAEEARFILYQMINNDIDGIKIYPNSHCFSAMLKAIINSRGDSISTQCEEIMETMKQLYEETSAEDLKPTVFVYNNLIQAYAEEISIMKKSRSQTNILFPGSSLSVIAEIDFDCKKLIEKATNLIENMEAQEGANDTPQPDSFTYCSICNLLAKVGTVEAAVFSEKYLRKVKGYDTPTWNAAISAWASLCTLDGAQRAHELLLEMENASVGSYNLMNAFQGPNSLTYHTVISAWTRAQAPGDTGVTAAKAEQVLYSMIAMLKSDIPDAKRRFSPSVIAFSSIIDCWSKSGSENAWQRALKMIDLMREVNVQPNVITFTSVMTACARSNSVEGAVKSSEILQHMKNLYLETEDEDYKPNAVSYFAAIDSWARSGYDDAGTKAHELLTEMESLFRINRDPSLQPEPKIYARVIAAYTNSKVAGSDEHAISLLQNMEHYALTGDENYSLAKPNIVLYNTLINSFARRGMSKKALAILNQMDRFNSMITNDSDKVNVDEQCLSSIIYALSMSNLEGKARKALKILERLERSHIDGNWRAKPTARTYNMVLNCCSNTLRSNKVEVAEALTIVFDVYARLRTCSYADVDRFTYISLLKACGKLIPHTTVEKATIIRSIFEDCCEDGLVDDDVIKNFIAAVPYDSLNSILDENVLSGNLPSPWTRNVKGKDQILNNAN